ncbi:MAG: M15 family metallopeptidase [Candidatus Pacebacteria bacterium]|nr:M15 family metallopeptidase [Candidatus Paceibacterota bacterium]
MKKFFSQLGLKIKQNWILLAILFISLGVIGYGGYRLYRLHNEKIALLQKVAGLESDLRDTQNTLAQIQDEKNGLSTTLNSVQEENQAYSKKVDNLSSTVDTLNGTVDTLHKIVETDPQLLLKYSKVFFLNENYVPTGLATITPKYILNKDYPLQIHDKVWPFLENMLKDANADKMPILVASGYRSFQVQSQIKSRYAVIYGAGTANSFSADQGYSEHQLGTTVDVTIPSIGGGLTGFETTQSYQWLLKNAYKYGFILSYPQYNKYYIFEPWHWRFVGLDLALRLHDENKHFYDLDQREINKYLLYIFNTKTTPNISTTTPETVSSQ